MRWYRKLLKLMTKQDVINKLRIILPVLLVYAVSSIMGVNLAVPTFLLLLFFYFKHSPKQLFIRKTNLLHMTLLFMIILSISYFIISKGWSVLYIPFSLVPMLATILFSGLEVSLLMTLITAVVVSALANNNYYLVLLFLISGISSSILVENARRRVAVIQAGFFIGVVQVLTLLLIDRFFIVNPSKYLIIFLNGLACGIIVIGILPVFEYLFKTVTNISLLELSDFNHPLLQRMILEAPGTYHHSLVVGNLSEAACRAVGAHALLARVGAYYHDVGKLSKPDYFSENQSLNLSRHDNLSATMSKLIIMNHVKEGMELANKFKLSPRITDFILQHHGNSLVYYFYRRALEGLEEDQEIREEGFRYPGPKPDTKETAIVLLADSVEAATRALKDPDPEKIKELVHKVINNKFIDGQLDECELTLKDLEKISAIFIHILGGIYHSRVTYPEETKSENNHKKSAKEDSHLSAKDKKNNS
ncbi:MAG: HDIG domain-containing protein [Candidatus Omnitrophica bacterium]|nr:HDIG domain-containing protein [Candidatus Omnitrophota bacterium]